MTLSSFSSSSFFFNATATPDISTLSLHDALPILLSAVGHQSTFKIGPSKTVGLIQSPRRQWQLFSPESGGRAPSRPDRKSTRLNSSHANISYAVFCLKKKKKK